MLNRRADKLELIRIAEAVALEKSIDKELIIGSMENGIAKAATLFLMRQYTLEYGKNGIRANGVNPDRVNTDFGGKGYIAKRAKARGVSTQSYVSDNLLKAEVLPEDVADAFVSLTKSKKTTGNILTVDSGNISATLR